MTSYKHKMRLAARAALAALLGASVLSGCSTYNSASRKIVQHITPYRVTIVQGNFVSSDAAAKLRVGMTRDEVRAALGTPLLTDMFHPERWDYIFYFKRGSTSVVEQRDVVINFNGDTLASWSGTDDLPTNRELIDMIDSAHSEQSWLREQRNKKADAANALAADQAAHPAKPATAAPAASDATASPGAASAGTAPNVQAADQANRTTTTPPSGARTSALPIAPNTPSLGVVHGGQTSGSAPSPEVQFHFSPPNHLRPAGGSSLLARPPGDSGTADGASTGTGTQ